MTKMFGNLGNEGLEEATDRLGGGGTVPTGVYDATVKVAYAGKAQSGAQRVTVVLDLNGFEFREDVYITNKKGENFYQDKNDASKKHPLPGYTTIDDLCMVTTEKPLTDQDVEEKVLEIWDFEQRANVPTNVPVLTGLTGKPVKVAIQESDEDKNVKDASGNYVPSGETRRQNSIEKIMHPVTGQTLFEARKGQDAAWGDKWQDLNKDKVKNNAKGAQGSKGAPAAAGKPAGNAGTPSLFGK